MFFCTQFLKGGASRRRKKRHRLPLESIGDVNFASYGSFNMQESRSVSLRSSLQSSCRKPLLSNSPVNFSSRNLPIQWSFFLWLTYPRFAAVSSWEWSWLSRCTWRRVVSALQKALSPLILLRLRLLTVCVSVLFTATCVIAWTDSTFALKRAFNAHVYWQESCSRRDRKS